MNPRVWVTISYAPGLVLLLAGIAVLVTAPLTTPLTCSCSTGPNGTLECPPCPTGYVIHPLGPFLLVGAAIYALVTFLFWFYWHSRH